MGKPREIPEEQRVYIKEAAERLDRRMGTLRKWDVEKALPIELRPRRGKKGWRYWTDDQIEKILKWIEDTDRRPGKALAPLSDPTKVTPEQVRKQIHALRGKRSDKNKDTE